MRQDKRIARKTFSRYRPGVGAYRESGLGRYGAKRGIDKDERLGACVGVDSFAPAGEQTLLPRAASRRA